MGVVIVLQYPQVLVGAQLDADGYMRLVRVNRLVETWGWFDTWIPRSNWPLGDVLHWTRPLDVLVIVLALPFLPFVGTDAAIHVAGSLISPVLHLASCLALIWVVAPVVSRSVRAWAAPALLVQPVVFNYGLAGRADHHSLITFLFVLALGASLRWLVDPARERWAFAAGLICALGLWVSPEFLVPLALFLGAGVALWLRSGQVALGANLSFVVGLALGVVGALLLERPPSAWLTVEYDRISIAHWTMSLVAAGFWLAVAGIRWAQEGRASAGRGTPGRLAGAGMGAVAATLVLAAIHPDFFRGPWISADVEVQGLWLGGVQELQPLLPAGVGGVLAGELSGIGRAVAVLGSVVVVLPFLAWRLRERWKKGDAVLWGFLGVATFFFAVMGLGQIRWGVYAGVLLAVGVVAFLDTALAAIDLRARGRGRLPLRLGLMIATIPGFLLAGYALESMVITPERESAERVTTAAGDDAACPIAGLASFLEETAVPGNRPVTILAHVDHGPEILFRTRHRVLAGPYHRNRRGILDVHAAFNSPDGPRVREIIEVRRVELIMLCPDADRSLLGQGPPESVFHRLVGGPLPPWATAVDLPDDVGSSIRLFRVRLES